MACEAVAPPAGLSAFQVFACESCGAAVEVHLLAGTSQCPYCAAPLVVTNPESAAVRPTHVIPFTIVREEAIRRLAKGLGVRADLSSVRGVYVPALVGTAIVHAEFQVELPLISSTHGPSRSAGRWSGEIGDVWASGSRALSTPWLRAVGPFDTGALVPWTAGLLSGWLAEQPTRVREECERELIVESAHLTKRAVHRMFPMGTRVTELRPSSASWSLVFVLVPIWVLAVRSGSSTGSVRRALVNGQTGRVLTDRRATLVEQQAARAGVPRGVEAFFARSTVISSEARVRSSDATDACTGCGTALEEDELRCPVCRGYAVGGEPAECDEAETTIVRCDGCGAAVSYDPGTRSLRCDFCAGTMHIERTDRPPGAPEVFVPFSVDETAARAAVRAWIARLGWTRPKALLREAEIEHVRPLWWAGWVADAQVLLSWSSVIRDDFEPHPLRLGQLEFDLPGCIVPASTGLYGTEATALSSGLPVSHASSEPVGPAHATVERFATDRTRMITILLERAGRVAKPRLPRGFIAEHRTSGLVTRMVSRRYAFPAWVLAYRFRGRSYRVVVSGQDARRVVGAAPVDLVRTVAAVLLMFVLLVLTVAIAGLQP